MPDNDVKVKLKASLGMDAGDVQKAMTALNQQLQTKAGGTSEADMLKYVNQWLQKVMGSNGSYIEQRKKLIASYREELKLVRELEQEFKKSGPAPMVSTGNATADMAAADAREAGRQRQVEEARNFTKRLKETIDTRTAEEAAGGSGATGGLVGWTLKRAPIIGTIAAGIMGARLLKRKADEWSELSETMDIGYANLGRRLGAGTGIRGPMEGGSPGKVSPGMTALGYSGTDILKMGEAYSIPGRGMNAAIEAQGAFARAYGFGENVEEISGIGKRATQLGIAEPLDQPAFFRTLADAVMHGERDGIDASGSIKALLGLTEEVAQHTGIVSRQDVGSLSGIVKAFTGTGSRFFKDERGAENIKGMLDAVQHPSGIGIKRFVQNAIMTQYGNRVPTAKERGLAGEEAAIYEKRNPQGKLDYIMDTLHKDPALFGYILRQFHAASGGNDMMEQALFDSVNGLSGAKSVAAQLAMSGKGSGFLKEARTVELGGYGARHAMEGIEPPAGITGLETNRQARAAAAEGLSSTASMATQQLRTDWELGLKSGAEKLHDFVESLKKGIAGIDEAIAQKRAIQDQYSAQQERLRSMGSSRAKQLAPSGN